MYQDGGGEGSASATGVLHFDYAYHGARRHYPPLIHSERTSELRP